MDIYGLDLGDSPYSPDDQLPHVLPLEVAGLVVDHRHPDPPLESVVEEVDASAGQLVGVVDHDGHVLPARSWNREVLVSVCVLNRFFFVTGEGSK